MNWRKSVAYVFQLMQTTRLNQILGCDPYKASRLGSSSSMAQNLKATVDTTMKSHSVTRLISIPCRCHTCHTRSYPSLTNWPLTRTSWKDSHMPTSSLLDDMASCKSDCTTCHWSAGKWVAGLAFWGCKSGPFDLLAQHLGGSDIFSSLYSHSHTMVNIKSLHIQNQNLRTTIWQVNKRHKECKKAL